jgi:hypothetical protein
MAIRKGRLKGRLSLDQIRMGIWDELDEAYPGEPGDYSKFPTIIDIYIDDASTGFVLARVWINDLAGIYKIPFTVSVADEIELGTPTSVVEAGADAPLPVGHLTVSGQGQIVKPQDAPALLAQLKEANPLIAKMSAGPNGHLIVLDLTEVGKPSQHEGPVQYQLARAGAAEALLTLPAKPLHVTANLDGHFDQGQPPKVIGVFLGGMMVDPGQETMRTVATVWPMDFPTEVQTIQAKREELGGSYEIEYTVESARRISASVVEIGSYSFTGGAILKKSAAAHKQTQLQVASSRNGDPVVAPERRRVWIGASGLGDPVIDDTRGALDVMNDSEFPALASWLAGSTSFTHAKQLTY